MDDNDGNLEFAREEYIELRVAQIKNQGIGAAAEEIPQKDEFQPSREPVKKRNIFIGIFIVVLLIVLIIVLGFLLHGYFN